LITIETHNVPPLDTEQRLSDYAVGIFQVITSRKGIKKAISKGLITVDGERGTTGKLIKGGEMISLLEARDKKPTIKLNIDILYEDDHLAIVNKPAGIVVSGNQKRTLENTLPGNLSPSEQIDHLTRPLPVHRLDHSTSGLLLVAKTRSCHTALSDLFAQREIQKTYHAIVMGEIKGEGVIETKIKEKSAETHYKVIKTIASNKYNSLNLVELKPVTGRRHQLRIHMLENGTPILGDRKYFIEGKVSKASGLFLCAVGLKFTHPVTEEIIEHFIDAPNKFSKIIEL
jgi:23S rRNA pseudouridine1911/1915/1917 synthase